MTISQTVHLIPRRMYLSIVVCLPRDPGNRLYVETSRRVPSACDGRPVDHATVCLCVTAARVVDCVLCFTLSTKGNKDVAAPPSASVTGVTRYAMTSLEHAPSAPSVAFTAALS